MVVRDFYFGAWLIKEHGYPYSIYDGKLLIDIDRNTLSLMSKSYARDHKEYFDCVKQLIRDVNKSRNSGKSAVTD